MKTQFTALPDWNFVGGETQKRTFTVHKESGILYDIPNGSARLAVVDFVNRSSSPVLKKEVSITSDASGKSCNASFVLDPSDTLAMSGKYLYQITISDGNGNTSIPSHGIMIVDKNIDPEFINAN